MGKQLRPLLYKPRVGLPVFTEHKVRRLLRRAKNADGVRINCYVRPQHLPANAPGAPYPDYMEDAYAEVPSGLSEGVRMPSDAAEQRKQGSERALKLAFRPDTQRPYRHSKSGSHSSNGQLGTMPFRRRGAATSSLSSCHLRRSKALGGLESKLVG